MLISFYLNLYSSKKLYLHIFLAAVLMAAMVGVSIFSSQSLNPSQLSFPDSYCRTIKLKKES